MRFHTSMEVASNERFIVLFLLNLELRQGFELISFLIRCAMKLVFSHSGSKKVLDAGKHSSPVCNTFLDLMPSSQVVTLQGIFSILALPFCFLYYFGLWASEGMEGWGTGYLVQITVLKPLSLVALELASLPGQNPREASSFPPKSPTFSLFAKPDFLIMFSVPCGHFLCVRS